MPGTKLGCVGVEEAPECYWATPPNARRRKPSNSIWPTTEPCRKPSHTLRQTASGTAGISTWNLPEKSINIKKSCHYGQVKIPVDGGTDACRFNANVCRMAGCGRQELHQNRIVQPCRPETHRGTAQCPAGHHRCQAAEGGTLFGQHGHDEGTLQTVNAEHLRFRHGEPYYKEIGSCASTSSGMYRN